MFIFTLQAFEVQHTNPVQVQEGIVVVVYWMIVNSPMSLLGGYVGYNQNKIAIPIKRVKRSGNHKTVSILNAMKPNSVKIAAIFPYLVMIL